MTRFVEQMLRCGMCGKENRCVLLASIKVFVCRQGQNRIANDLSLALCFIHSFISSATGSKIINRRAWFPGRVSLPKEWG